MGHRAGHEFAGTERFRIKRMLGAGGMGEVYEAFDREQGVVVAIKTLPVVDAASLSRFKREFRALADIEHPNLIRLRELIESRGHWFYTMDFVDGVNFLRYVRGERYAGGQQSSSGESTTGVATTEPALDASPDSATENWVEASTAPGSAQPEVLAPAFDEQRLRDAASQLAVALSALHGAGKIHRDVKPSNILVTDGGHLVLLDFGLVTEIADDLHASTQAHAVGTTAYMAPEQAISGAVGPAADWYSFGVVLYEALTGQLPYSGSTSFELLMKKQQYEPPPPRARNPHVPRDLDTLCTDLLIRCPDERASGENVLDRLGARVGIKPLTNKTTSSRFTQTMPFVGREEEIQRLRNAFADSHNSPTAAVIRGESGLGKTELARRFTEMLQQEVPQTLVLAGRCYERESVAYKAIDGIADALAKHMRRLPKEEAASLLPMRASLLPRLFPIFQRVDVISRAPTVDDTLDPQEFRRRSFEALRELLARISQRQPLVLVIDDLQWTDADSMTLLQEVLSHHDAPRLLLIATMRPLGDEARDKGMTPLDDMLSSIVIDLTPLSPAAAQRLGTLLLPDKTDEEVDSVVREACGHPLFLQELARYADAVGDHVASFDEMLWSRVAKLGRERSLLEILSIAGSPIRQNVAANAAGMDYTSYLQALAVLRVGYFARTDGMRQTDDVSVYHDRIREVVLAHLDPFKRRQRHEQLAAALQNAGAAATNPHALVGHAEASGDTARAALYAEAAAGHAVEAMAFDRAAEFFELAVRLGQHSEQKRRALRHSTAECLVSAGQCGKAAAIFLDLAELVDPVTRRDFRRRAAEQLLISGRISAALETLDSVLGDIGMRVPRSLRRVILGIVWNRIKLRLRGFGWSERHERQIADDELARLDVLRVVGEGIGMVDNIRGAYFHSYELLLALRLGERHRLCRALALESIYVAREGGRGLERAGQLAASAKTMVEPGEFALEALMRLSEGIGAFFSGDFHVAANVLRDAERSYLSLAGATWELNNVRAFRLFALHHAGLWRERRHCVYEYLRDARRRGDLYAETSMTRNCHVLWLADDDTEQMCRRIEQTSWTPPEQGYHLQHWYELEADVQGALYTGSSAASLDSACASFAQLRRSLLRRVQIVRAISAWLWARMWLSVAENPAHRQRAIKEAKTSRRELQRERVDYASVWARLVDAAIATHTDPDRTEKSLRDAVGTADANGMRVTSAIARRRLGELLGGDEGTTLVTEADSWMASEGIVNPGRMTEVYAPGFRRFG